MASLGEGALKTDVPATMTLQPAIVGYEKRAMLWMPTITGEIGVKGKKMIGSV